MAKIAPYLAQNLADDNLKIALGVYPGVASVNKYGRNRAVTSGGAEEISSLSAAAVRPATALMTTISQTTDQVASRGKTVRVIGLDANFDVVNQTALLNATDTTTKVTLGTALQRVNSFSMESSVAIDSTVRLHNTAENQDYAIILVGDDEAHQAFYTVPSGKTAYMTNYWAIKNLGGGEPTDLDILLKVVNNASPYIVHTVDGFGLDPDGGIDFKREFKPYKAFVAQSDIILEAVTVGAAADVSGGFDLILVDN